MINRNKISSLNIINLRKKTQKINIRAQKIYK